MRAFWVATKSWFQHFTSAWLALAVSSVVIGYPLVRGSRWLTERETETEEPLLDYAFWADRIELWQGRALLAGLALIIIGLVVTTIRSRRCLDGQRCTICADREIERAGHVAGWVAKV